jgi:hypothetical protein
VFYTVDWHHKVAPTLDSHHKLPLGLFSVMPLHFCKSLDFELTMLLPCVGAFVLKERWCCFAFSSTDIINNAFIHLFRNEHNKFICMCWVLTIMYDVATTLGIPFVVFLSCVHVHLQLAWMLAIISFMVVWFIINNVLHTPRFVKWYWGLKTCWYLVWQCNANSRCTP